MPWSLALTSADPVLWVALRRHLCASELDAARACFPAFTLLCCNLSTSVYTAVTCYATLYFHCRIAEAWPRQLPPCTQVRRTPFPTCWGTFRLTVVGLMDRQTYASTPVIKRRKRRLKSQPCHEGAVMWCHLYVVHLRIDRDSRRTRAGRWPRFGSLVRYFR